MNSTFQMYDENSNPMIADTTDVKINPSGCNLKVKVYPEKSVDQKNQKGVYLPYKTIMLRIPKEKRDEFEKICKKILSNKKEKKEKKEKSQDRCCVIIRTAKIKI